MSRHKLTSAACAVIVCVSCVLTAMLMAGTLGIEPSAAEPAYASKLFDTSLVHRIDVIVPESDWSAMIADARNEEYIRVSVTFDGTAVKNVGVRPKGNSSLSMIAGSDSDRYSFKLELDHYQDAGNYYGLDKLALNNIAQDNTCMKDYVTYQMMNAAGAYAPLSSFGWLTVNGQDSGLYLACEGAEDAFAKRVFADTAVRIYKPDTMDMNGGGFGGADAPGGTQPQGGSGDIRPGGGMSGGMRQGGATSLIYSTDDPSDYSAIFDNATGKVSSADKARMIGPSRAAPARPGP